MTEPGAAAACAFAGILAGPLYTVLSVLCAPLRYRAARITADLLFFLLFAAVFAGVCAAFRLPAVRAYMILSALAGLLLYLISLHRILAFFGKRLYNKCRSSCKAIFMRLKRAHERRKVQKGSDGGDGRGRPSARRPAHLPRVSAHRDLGAQKP